MVKATNNAKQQPLAPPSPGPRIDNDNHTDSNYDGEMSHLMQHPTIPGTTASPRELTSKRRQQSQRVDMTGQLTAVSEDFHSRFHKVLEEQGYNGLAQREELQSVATHGKSTDAFSHDADGTKQSSASTSSATEDNSSSIASPYTSTSNTEKSSRFFSPIKANAGIDKSADRTRNPAPSPSSDSSSPSRLIEKKRRVLEIRRLNKTIGELTQSLRERGNARTPQQKQQQQQREPQHSPSVQAQTSGAPNPAVWLKAASFALLPKTIGDVAAPDEPNPPPTVPTTTIYETRSSTSYCREIASGLPITVDRKPAPPPAVLLNTTTSTCSSDEGGFFPAELKTLPPMCRTVVIVFAVLGIIVLGIYLGYMSYMIRANNQM